MNIMKNSQTPGYIIILFSILSLLISVVTNIATTFIPDWLSPLLTFTWPILLILGFVYIFLSIYIERNKSKPENIPLSGIDKVDWGEAPSTMGFVGRNGELQIVRNLFIKKRAKIVFITGMAGIGKSSLAAEIVYRFQDEFDSIIWRSVAGGPEIEDVLSQVILHLSSNIVFPAKNFSEQTSSLLNLLRKKRCLIILDNFETLLQEDASYHPGFDKYGLLLDAIAKADHGSCIVITTRRTPVDTLQLAQNKQTVGFIRPAGLETKEIKSIVKNIKLIGEEEDWQKLNEKLSGNPLAVQITTYAINNFYAGSIRDFLTSYKVIPENLMIIMYQQIKKLTSLEIDMLITLSLLVEPVDLNKITYSDNLHQTMSLLEKLLDAGLINKNLRSNKYYLQEVVKELIYLLLIDTIKKEVLSRQYNFLIKFSLVDAQSKEYVQRIQREYVIKPLVEKLILEFDTQNHAIIFFKNTTDEFRKLGKVGYAASNLFSILSYLNALPGSNFSNLVLKNANLQHREVHNVNFQDSQLIGCVFTEHFGSLMSVELSPDGAYLISGSSNGEIIVWSYPELILQKKLYGHKDWVRCISFSPTEPIIASGSSDYTIRLWNYLTGESIGVLEGHSGWVTSLDFHPNGIYLYSGAGDKTVKVWDIRTKELLKTLTGHSDWITCLKVDKSGKYIVSGSGDKSLKKWDLESLHLEHTFTGHEDRVRTLDVSPEGDYVASAGNDKDILVWDFRKNTLVASLVGHTDLVRSVEFLSNGESLASAGSDNTIRIWDTNPWSLKKIIDASDKRIKSLSSDSTSRKLISGADDLSIRIWDIESGLCDRIIQGYQNPILSMVHTSKLDLLISANDNGTITFWKKDNELPNQTSQIGKSRLWSLDLSPDGTQIICGGDDRVLRTIKVDTGEILKEMHGHTSWISCVKFDKVGKNVLSCGGDGVIRIWELNSDKTHALESQNTWITSLDFIGRENLIVSGATDNSLSIWDYDARKLINKIDIKSPIKSVKVSDDSRYIIVGTKDHVEILDVDESVISKVSSYPIKELRSLAVNKSFSKIAIGANNTLHLINFPSGESLTIPVSGGNINAILFYNEDQLAMCCDDETIKIVNINRAAIDRELRIGKFYEGCNFMGVSGLNLAQKVNLKTLGGKNI